MGAEATLLRQVVRAIAAEGIAVTADPYRYDTVRTVYVGTPDADGRFLLTVGPFDADGRAVFGTVSVGPDDDTDADRIDCQTAIDVARIVRNAV